MRHGENHVRLQALHRAPPQQPTPSVVKPEGRPAASEKPRQESCVRSSGTVTLLARGPSDSWGRSPVDDQSCRGHQCSETTLTGESRFHTSTPPGDLNLGSLWREANRLVHWTSETWWESCEIAGSPQGNINVREYQYSTGKYRRIVVRGISISARRGWEEGIYR